MIIGIISTIFSILGIYGFFCNNLFLLYLGMGSVIVEHIIGILTGQEKSLSTAWISLLVAFGLIMGGINWLQAIAICLCFEGTICFVLGIIVMLFVGTSINKSQNENVDNSETLSNIISDQTRLNNIIAGSEEINWNLIIGKTNPYTGQIINNHNDAIQYLKMYKLDYEGIDPMKVINNVGDKE